MKAKEERDRKWKEEREKREKEKEERERVEKEKRERQEKEDRERQEKERLAKEEQLKLEREKKEKEERERLLAEQQEQEKRQKEIQAEKDREEAERLTKQERKKRELPKEKQLLNEPQESTRSVSPTPTSESPTERPKIKRTTRVYNSSFSKSLTKYVRTHTLLHVPSALQGTGITNEPEQKGGSLPVTPPKPALLTGAAYNTPSWLSSPTEKPTSDRSSLPPEVPLNKPDTLRVQAKRPSSGSPSPNELAGVKAQGGPCSFFFSYISFS